MFILHFPFSIFEWQTESDGRYTDPRLPSSLTPIQLLGLQCERASTCTDANLNVPPALHAKPVKFCDAGYCVLCMTLRWFARLLVSNPRQNCDVGAFALSRPCWPRGCKKWPDPFQAWCPTRRQTWLWLLFILCYSIFCFCCVGFSFVSNKLSDWLTRASLKRRVFASSHSTQK